MLVRPISLRILIFSEGSTPRPRPSAFLVFKWMASQGIAFLYAGIGARMGSGGNVRGTESLFPVLLKCKSTSCFIFSTNILWTLNRTHVCLCSNFGKQLHSCGLHFSWSFPFQVKRPIRLVDPSMSTPSLSQWVNYLPPSGDHVSSPAGRNSRSSCKGEIKIPASSPIFNFEDAHPFIGIFSFYTKYCKLIFRDDLYWLLSGPWFSLQSPLFWIISDFYFISEYKTWPLSILKVIYHSLPTHRFISASWSLASSAWCFTSRKKLIPFPNCVVKKNDLTWNREL